MRTFLLCLILCAASAFANDTPCTSGSINSLITGASVICNVTYDSTNPSGQTYARTVGAIVYPTAGGQANSTCPIPLYGPGKGWTGAQHIPLTYLVLGSQQAETQLAINAGYCIWAPFETLAARIAGTATAGATSISVTALGANNYWPNDPTCQSQTQPQCGVSGSYTALFGGNTANSETITVTGTSGSGSTYTLTVTGSCGGTLCHSHTSDYLELPNSQFPAQVNDTVSLLNFIGAHAGKNDTACNGGACPGNPHQIMPWVGSSDSNNMLQALAHPSWLANCGGVTGWNGGVSCGSSNSATGWQIGHAVFVSVPLDLAWMYANSCCTSGASDGGIADAAIRSVLGCTPGTDTGGPGGDTCTQYAQLFSPAYHPPSLAVLPSAFLEVGTADFTTPVCTAGATWPCSSGQYSTFQAAYNPTGLNFQVVIAAIHGCFTLQCIPDADNWLFGSKGSTAGGVTVGAGISQ